MIRRGWLGAVSLAMLSFGVGATPARAALTTCSATFPVDPGCRIEAVASGAYVTAIVAGDLFVGYLTYRIEGPYGEVTTDCVGDGIGVTCKDERRTGDFAPGDPIEATVTVAGAGAWTFELYH